ncbi:SAV_2336 N-terminal domain-related protein [Streptomyces sp. 891-h]|uniref:SAV_2336 N-terminal domain-related protein n=1 Tax=Streptomyces sp. 891-h TaxID=2720714 RepID=UPI001FA97737|nr:SAV_2336 N-terminal domain-related protein [Streptomyces sp. 891-h]UNZ17334.1 tetratricopeptide repeat protein [Streptomyces sp. 891-h]
MSAASPPPRRPLDAPRSTAASWPGQQPLQDVTELVARLRAAGWDPSSEELAEALWLARFDLASAAGEPDADSTRPGYPEGRKPQPEPPMPPVEDHAADEPEETPPGPERTAPVSLFAPRRHGGAPPAGFPVRAPAAGALSGLLELQHALRPLHGYRPPLPPAKGALDEDATADLSARSTAVRPVFGTEVRRYSEIQLIMDASPTASVWQPTLERLRQTFEQLGAFRDVQVRYLHRARDGAPLIGTGPADGTARLRPADEYRDTTGRRLTLVVSDCVGALWQDGRAQRLLHHWSGRSPLAVVQPLPPRLWPRTALPAEPGQLLRERGLGGRVTFEPDSYGPPPPAEAVPVPVLLPTPEALGNWARLLGTDSERAVAGAAAWVLPRHPAMPAPRTPAGGVPARTLLREFRNSASPGALDLAVHLAVVPLLLPVIHLVQEAMLPDTGPMELAEVLLSGLLTRLPEDDGPEGTNCRRSLPGPRYAFAPGVRDLLLQSLDQGAAVLILKHLSGYVAQRFGKGTRNFAAMAVAQLTGRAEQERAEGEPAGTVEGGSEPDEAEDGDEMFATIPAEVVRFYLPEQTAADQVAETERLLRRWRAQGDIQLLHRARSVGEAARAADRDSARARLALGRVLHALAGTAAVRRSPQGPEPLLRDAAELLTDSVPGTLLERAGVEHSLWQISGGTRHLLRAEGLLRSLAGRTGAPQDTADPSLPPDAERTRKLRLGRVLLALAQTAPEHRHRAALEAVGELREASDMLADRAPGSPEPSSASATSETQAVPVARQKADAGGREAGGRDETGAQRCGALLDLAAALRLSGAPPQERLDVLAQAGALAGERSGLRLRSARERARVLRETRDWEAAAEAYREAEGLTERDSAQRGELLIEWGEMLLGEAGDLTRAEGLLREALTRAPSGSSTVARAALLLGRALLLRYERENFLPDLYEGCHLLEQAARQGPDADSRAQAWLRLGRARALFPAAAPESQQAAAEFGRALEELAQERERGSLTAARALHARAGFHRSQGRTEEALADYRAAEAEWQLLAGHLADIPWEEVRDTRDRVAELS